MISCFKGKFKVTSPYGKRWLFDKYEFHKGVDIVGIDDDTVYSICDGVAYCLYNDGGFGNYVRVDIDKGLSIIYGHLKSYKIKSGTKVKAGQPIGVMGATGNVTGVHTHLEIRKTGTKEPLDIHYYTGIPKSLGIYDAQPEFTAYEAACNVERICGLTKDTINYMWNYEYGGELFKKLNLKIFF